MHESTIKLMSTPVSTLPTLINEHINEYLYGAYNVSTKYPLYEASALDDLIRVIQERATPDNATYLISNFEAAIYHIKEHLREFELLHKLIIYTYSKYNIIIYLDNLFNRFTAVKAYKILMQITPRQAANSYAKAPIMLSPVLMAQLILEG